MNYIFKKQENIYFFTIKKTKKNEDLLQLSNLNSILKKLYVLSEN